jgi:alkaline phosphatase D
MRVVLSVLVLGLCFISCKTVRFENEENTEGVFDATIAFGSCNKQELKNKLWIEVLKNKPDLWIWGGDNVYSDTDNMVKLKADYEKLLADENYIKLKESTEITGTWDDHDYGLNDGGEEFHAKKGSQKLFLDFLDVPENDERRGREGVYSSRIVTTAKGTIKVIVLDTRYFRSALTPSKDSKKRYGPGIYGEGTILGKKQWNWLENELKSSGSDFNLIVSSIQLLSAEHGFETWGNFPHEVDRLKNIIKNSEAKGVIVLSGDRHISEFSKTEIEGLNYPLIDFTSSGLTHVYSSFSGEPNKYRILKVVPKLSFGVLRFNFEEKTILMEMRGINNALQQKFLQTY